MKEMEKRDQKSYPRAWRVSTLTRLCRHGLITVSKPENLTPS